MSKKRWWIFIPLVLVIIYLMGPRPKRPHYGTAFPPVPMELNEVDKYVLAKESVHKLKPDNHARIIWTGDSARSKTEYSILYLHGFTASQGEGIPVHQNIATKFNCNLYLSRLAEHGLDTTDQLIRLTASNLWESAKEAYVIASRLGNKVIVMGTSTGATLALMLAAAYPEIHSLILLSPNIEIFDENAWLLNNPWGLQIARMVKGSKYVYQEDTRPLYKKYWSYGYRLEGVVALEEMLESSMKPRLFKRIKQPVLMLYYYKDPVFQDSVVRVDAMHKMFNSLGTPPDIKRAKSIPTAGNHVLGSYIKSNDVVAVENEIEKFMVEVLKVK